MMQFWIGSFLLLLFIGLPFVLRSRQAHQQFTQLELNKQIFKQRLADLKRQQASAELTENEYQQLEAELKASLLDDAVVTEQVKASQGPKGPLYVSLLGGGLAALALYLSMGNYRQLEEWQLALDDMPQLAEKLRSKTEKMSGEDLERFALALRTRLNEDDSDAMGWLLYGRIQMSFGRVNEATEALVNALHLQPENRTINLTYARVLAMSGDANKLAHAKGIYARLLAANPGDLDVLSQQAFTLLEVGDKQGAYHAWQAMLDLLPEDSSRHQQIKQTLAMLQGQGASPHVAPTEAQAPVESQQNVTDPLRVQVTVELTYGLELPEKGFLVIFAKAAQGTPMPMAVKRFPLTQLPVTVTLTQEDAMMENYTLASVEPFEVVAKVVENANVATAASLLEAKSQPLTKAELPIALTLRLKSVSQ